MKTEEILIIQDLRKKYSRVEALKGLDLTLTKGQICGLLGPNGSGKSTLLKAIVGLIKPDAGSIKIFGNSPSRHTKAQIAFVPEVDNLYRWMTIGQTIDFISSFYNDWEVEKETELLNFMGLERGKKVNSLSKGMRARLKLVLALARKAPLILLDEPFSGIDPSSKDRIIEGIIRQFKSEDQTMIISTHALGETEQLFDSVVFLDEGTINLQGNAEDLRLRHGKSINELFKEVFA